MSAVLGYSLFPSSLPSSPCPFILSQPPASVLTPCLSPYSFMYYLSLCPHSHSVPFSLCSPTTQHSWESSGHQIGICPSHLMSCVRDSGLPRGQIWHRVVRENAGTGYGEAVNDGGCSLETAHCRDPKRPLHKRDFTSDLAGTWGSWCSLLILSGRHMMHLCPCPYSRFHQITFRLLVLVTL